MSRTTITKNGALTNEDGKYTLVESPTVDTPYWVENYGWELQPFMTSITVKTQIDSQDLNDGIRIKLPNIKDVPVGHTIFIKFAEPSYEERVIIDMGQSEAEMHIDTIYDFNYNSAKVFPTEEYQSHWIDLSGMGDFTDIAVELKVLRFIKFVDAAGDDRWLFLNGADTNAGLGVTDVYGI